MPLRQRLRLLILLLCVIASAMRQAHAEGSATYDPHHVDGSGLGGLIDLSQSWLVYGGDDPRFADPGFDDSHWQVASLSHHLSDYGIRNQPIVWYRLHIKLSPSARDLSLDIDRFWGSMEAFANGEKIGQLGQMKDGGDLRQNNFHYLMPVSQKALTGGDLVISIRAAIGRGSEGERYFAGLHGATLGKSTLLQDESTLHNFSDLSSNGYRLLLQAITIFVLVALVIALPRQREYLALALSFAFEAADNIVHILTDTSFELIASAPIQIIVEDVLAAGALLTFLEFINLALGKASVRWIRLIQIFVALWMLFDVAWTVAIVGRLTALSPALNFSYSAIQLALWMPYSFLLPGLLIWNWKKRRNPDARLLLVAVAMEISIRGYLVIGYVLLRLHIIRSFSETIPIHFLDVQWGEVGSVTVNLTLLFYIILRVVRTVREGARYASEVEAAQTVQKVLLARSRQATPGYKVDTVYLPASEVGGDFFLVLPGDDGSLVAIVGDVAGKGMLAAMRVSVILGILRREDSRAPGTVLQRLNDAMISQGDMGLTTACCVRMEPDGRFTVANAGHISPYIAGREVASAGALPLGIAPEQEYEQTEGSLASGEALVLMSDGVVEARSSSNELYGFERLPALTQLPASEIANTARLFGQEDDITVMTLSCLA